MLPPTVIYIATGCIKGTTVVAASYWSKRSKGEIVFDQSITSSKETFETGKRLNNQ